MTREQRDDVRLALTQPEMLVSRAWWRAIAEQLLHDTEAAFEEGYEKCDAREFGGADENDRKVERQEWERDNPAPGSNDPESESP